MIETNVRLVQPGVDLAIRTRRAVVSGAHLSLDLVQKAATILCFRHGLAAVPDKDDPHALVVASDEAIAPIHLAGDDWEVEVMDAGLPTRRIGLDGPERLQLVPELIERALQAGLARADDLRTVGSPRIWYEPQPFKTEHDLMIYRRFETAALYLDGAGIGIAVDVGTAFLTAHDLAWFFDPRLLARERHRRAELFDELTRRQNGQKGTLVYDLGYRRMTCYFEDAPGVTCAETAPFRLHGERFDSVFDYYRKKNPKLPVRADTPAVLVCFPKAKRPVWVAANRLRARIMNDDVPWSLSSIDKIPPFLRRRLIEGFWGRVGLDVLGRVVPEGVDADFWRPTDEQASLLPIPALTFGNDWPLPPPTTQTTGAYKKHYSGRRDALARHGSYNVPPSTTRAISCAYPGRLGEEIPARFASDVASTILEYAGLHLNIYLVAYDTVADATTLLGGLEQSGAALVILNEEPAAYHEVAHRLQDWRIKRVTEHTLCKHYQLLKRGWHNRETGVTDLIRGQNRWKEFVTLCAIDLLQLLDVTPYRVAQAGPYDAQLAIDVGHDRRHLALSLLVARSQDRTPNFHLETDVAVKPDHHREEIEAVILRDKIIDLVDGALRRPCAPLASLLVIRDGRLWREEYRAIDDAVLHLKTIGKVTEDARIDFVELRKDTSICVRFWDVNREGLVRNPLEGTAIRLDADRMLVTATGDATLHQGTADPLLLVGNGRCLSVSDAAAAVFASAQMNWSNPAIAQKLPISLKRTDEELTARAAQEIRRIR
jgi:hypothetical protein